MYLYYFSADEHQRISQGTNRIRVDNYFCIETRAAADLSAYLKQIIKHNSFVGFIMSRPPPTGITIHMGVLV